LQNSDDAQSKAVEIRFETQKYTDKKAEMQISGRSDGGTESLPDLKTTPVCDLTFSLIVLNLACRTGSSLDIQE
jgi:hypothetical protein